MKNLFFPLLAFGTGYLLKSYSSKCPETTIIKEPNAPPGAFLIRNDKTVADWLTNAGFTSVVDSQGNMWQKHDKSALSYFV